MNTNSRLLQMAMEDAKNRKATYICQLSNDVQHMLRDKAISYYTREADFLGIDNVEEFVEENIMCEKVCELSHIFNPCELY